MEQDGRSKRTGTQPPHQHPQHLGNGGALVSVGFQPADHLSDRNQTIFAAAQQNANSWQAIQYIATGELLKAGGVALIVSPIIAEGLKMVLAEILSERRIRKAEERGLAKGREEGRAETRQKTHAEWADWVQRWRDAEAKGIPFDEPSPQAEDQTKPPR